MAKHHKKSVDFDERAGALRESRNLKMAGSAHAYVRGNTRKFYEWLDTTDSSKVPQGPPIWICGNPRLPYPEAAKRAELESVIPTVPGVIPPN